MTAIPPIAFVGASVLAMTDENVVPNQTVLVEGDRITAIGPVAEVTVPDGARVIDASGKTLIPGLFDMHTHIVPHIPMPREGEDPFETSLDQAGEYLGLFLAYGVTTIRNQAGSEFLLKVREAARAGRYPAPTITLSGPTCEQVFLPRSYTYRAHVPTPEAAEVEINRQADAGYDCVKVYNNVSKEVFEALMRTARARGIKIGGHIPIPVGLMGAMEAGLDCVEHLRGFDALLDSRPFHERGPAFQGDTYSGWRFSSPEAIADLADKVAQYDTWHSPTMLVEDPEHSEVVYPDEVKRGMPWSVRQHLEGLRAELKGTPEERGALNAVRDARREMLRELDRRDVKLIAGSDCPGARTRLIPGHSLLSEIEIYVASGISPYRALRAATVMPARYLEMEDSRGTLEVGKRADMVMLDADPLADISAIRKQSGVMAGGDWFPTGAELTANIFAWRNAPGAKVAHAKGYEGDFRPSPQS